MRVVSVRCYTGRGFVCVAVETDGGITGYGECSHMDNDAVATLVMGTVAPAVTGMPLHDLEAMEYAVMTRNYKKSGQLLAMAWSGVEIAVWDARGKVLGLPVHDLMGGRFRDSVDVYASSMRRDPSPQQEADRLLRAVGEHGFRAVKIKVGPRMGRGGAVDTAADAEKVGIVRKALGPGIRLMVDANSSYNLAQAMEFCKRIDGFGVYHLEEPLPYYDTASYRRLAETVGIPLHVGEQDWNLHTFRDFIAGNACHYYAVDPIKCGGLMNAKRAAVLCRAFGVTFAPHNTSRGLGMAAVLQLAASTPEYGYFVEYNLDAEPLKEAFLDTRFEVVDGKCRIPAGPGLGVNIDEGAMRRAMHLA